VHLPLCFIGQDPGLISGLRACLLTAIFHESRLYINVEGER